MSFLRHQDFDPRDQKHCVRYDLYGENCSASVPFPVQGRWHDLRNHNVKILGRSRSNDDELSRRERIVKGRDRRENKALHHAIKDVYSNVSGTKKKWKLKKKKGERKVSKSAADDDGNDDKSRRLRLMRELEDIVRKEERQEENRRLWCSPTSNYSRSRV
tara:strand:+ start:108 stop:587 length:480 start_codon:yes stop_codon:yes gene_type:complete